MPAMPRTPQDTVQLNAWLRISPLKGLHVDLLVTFLLHVHEIEALIVEKSDLMTVEQFHYALHPIRNAVEVLAVVNRFTE
jgi:hypothetical protein